MLFAFGSIGIALGLALAATHHGTRLYHGIEPLLTVNIGPYSFMLIGNLKKGAGGWQSCKAMGRRNENPPPLQDGGF